MEEKISIEERVKILEEKLSSLQEKYDKLVDRYDEVLRFYAYHKEDVFAILQKFGYA